MKRILTIWRGPFLKKSVNITWIYVKISWKYRENLSISCEYLLISFKYPLQEGKGPRDIHRYSQNIHKIFTIFTIWADMLMWIFQNIFEDYLIRYGSIFIDCNSLCFLPIRAISLQQITSDAHVKRPGNAHKELCPYPLVRQYLFICLYVSISFISVHIRSYVYICWYFCICEYHIYLSISVHMFISAHMFVSVNIVKYRSYLVNICQYVIIFAYRDYQLIPVCISPVSVHIFVYLCISVHICAYLCISVHICSYPKT